MCESRPNIFHHHPPLPDVLPGFRAVPFSMDIFQISNGQFLVLNKKSKYMHRNVHTHMVYVFQMFWCLSFIITAV